MPQTLFEDLGAAEARLEKAEAAARKRADALRQDLAAADARCKDLEAGLLALSVLAHVGARRFQDATS